MLRTCAAFLLLIVVVWLEGCADLASNAQQKPADPIEDVVQDPADSPAKAEKPVSDGQASVESLSAVDGGNRFAFDLYHRLQSDPGNLFYSPASISVALAMTYAGAAGATASEMADALHFDGPKNEVADGMAELLASWRTSDEKQGFRLDVANRLWGQRDFVFVPEFLALTRDKYGAELATVDFAGATEEARQTINGWVEEQTENRITNLIPSAGALQDSRLVLTNAVYFKGGWSAPFDDKSTQEGDFHVAASQSIKVPLMRQRGKFAYAEADGVQVLELPYGDRSLSMVVVLPEATDGLADVEANLSRDSFDAWTGMLRSQEVVIVLPKFTTRCEFDLVDVLQPLGMTSAFNPQLADFSGMSPDRDLFLSAVFHQAFVDVNEEGTEAAAATAAVMTVASLEVGETMPKQFRADHPFIVVIRDNRNGSILFMGRVVDPTD